MGKSVTKTVILIVLLNLLTACGPAAPAATPVPPTSTPIPITTPAPPTQAPVPPTATLAPTETAPPTPTLPPLDGSGGGIIAYCYEPASGNDLKEGIYAINADGSGNMRIIDAPIGLNYPDWSPDGKGLAAIGYVSESTWSIYTFDADGTNLERLTMMNDVWDTDPSWSPNGSQIAFTRIYPSQNNRAEIWIMNADGSNQHWIGIEGGSAKWSPDGTRLIYHSMKGDNYDLYTCNADGTDERQLTSTTYAEITPAWSPDGSLIAVTAVGDDFGHQVYVMNSDGTNPHPLTDSETGAAAPRWSPDGSLIAFKSGGDVYVISTEGTNAWQVTNSPTGMKAINPAWRPSTTTPSSAGISCQCPSLDPLQTQLVYDVETSHDTGFWSFSTPEEEGMDSDRLEAGVAALAEFSNLYSVLIVRNDKIVLERYFQKEEPRHARNIQSASKSFLSALVGIAIHEGYIHSVDQTAAEFLPTYFASMQDPRKLDITLRHLLTMTPGFSYQDNLYGLQGDWLATAISYPLVSEPGSEFRYSTISSHILSAVLTEATGMSTCEFACQYLFQPMAITIDNWSRDPQGYYIGGAAMYFTPRELARFGLLYLHNGVWDGHPVVPAEWIAESMTRHVDETGFPGVSYGYSWWRESAGGYEVYAAVGHGGQTIRIVPGLNLVVVTTADSYAPAQGIEAFPLLEEYVIPSVEDGIP